MKLRVIVNPSAGAGSAGRRIRDLERALAERGLGTDVVQTRSPGDATELARRARADGVEVLGIMGGDGTVNEVAQAYLDESGVAIRGPEIALIPSGTGGDFRKTFGLGADPLSALDRLVAGSSRALDLGVLEVRGPRGEPVRRAFLNIASFGIAGRVVRIVNAGPKWIGGRAAFFAGTLRAMAVYRNAPVSVQVDGKPWFEGPVVNVAIANGQYFGGGMKIAPAADPSDGIFDIVALGDLSLPQSLSLSSKIYRGEHIGTPKVSTTRGTVVEARPIGDTPVLVDLDGEAPGSLPLIARLFPGALRIRV